MGLEVKLFVHGVSKGHKAWGAKEADAKYANAFYSTSWPLKEMMMVEVRENGSSPCCYYSFIRGEKVLGADKRDGSYFAITLRMNAGYTDLHNMYNILRAAYEKVCVGMCMQESGAFAQFTTDDFGTVDAGLQKLRDSIFGYISQFSTSSDIVSLSGFQQSKGKAGLEVNVSESNENDVLAMLKKTGKVLVSHLFPTTSEAKIQAAANQKIAQCQADAQRSIQAIQSKAEQSIRQVQEQCAREKKGVQDLLDSERRKSNSIRQEMTDECNKRIADIKDGYAKFDQREKELKEEIKQKEAEILGKNNVIAGKDKDIEKLKKSINALNQQVKQLQCSNSQGAVVANKTGCEILRERFVWLYDLVGVAMVLILIAILVLSSVNYRRLGIMKNTLCLPVPAAQVDSTARAEADTPDDQAISVPYTQAQADSVKKLYQFKIDIKELIGGGKALKTTRPYTLSLIAKTQAGQRVLLKDIFTEQQQGEYHADDSMEIREDTLVATKAGRFTLTYMVDGVEIVQRTITVTDK